MSLDPEILQQRYTAIERAYSARQWDETELLSTSLLSELPDDPRDALRQRLLLLLGHTSLYGRGDAPTARRQYQMVLDNSPEATLQEIAEQGVSQCRQLEQGQTKADSAATPWLDAIEQNPAGQQPRAPELGSAEALVAEIVDEPEQIEVAQADPARREEVPVEEIAAIGSGAARAAASGGRQRPGDSLAFDPSEFAPGELQELSRGLLRLRLS
jgi:hypothetical protein